MVETRDYDCADIPQYEAITRNSSQHARVEAGDMGESYSTGPVVVARRSRLRAPASTVNFDASVAVLLPLGSPTLCSTVVGDLPVLPAHLSLRRLRAFIEVHTSICSILLTQLQHTRCIQIVTVVRLSLRRLPLQVVMFVRGLTRSYQHRSALWTILSISMVSRNQYLSVLL